MLLAEDHDENEFRGRDVRSVEYFEAGERGSEAEISPLQLATRLICRVLKRDQIVVPVTRLDREKEEIHLAAGTMLPIRMEWSVSSDSSSVSGRDRTARSP